MELFDKPLALDPSKFDRAAFADDIEALFAAGYFDDIETEEELQQRLTTIAAKHYGNGELLLLSNTLQMVRSKLGEMMKKLENRITKDEAEDKGRRQGVESAANLRGILGEIMGMKAQGDRIEGKVGDLPKGLKAAAKEGAKAGVEGTLPKVYAKAANMSDEELRNAAKPKTRSSGGGRKKERDLDDAQVKTVLALTKRKNLESLRAYSVEIIRDMMNGKGEYQNPYDKPKDLDAAVRRYCKRIGKPLVFKPRKGKWSAKS